MSIGSSEAPFLANLNQFVEFVRDGQFDQIEQNHAGKLIAEGHAAKILNMRSTLLTLAGGDPMPAAVFWLSPLVGMILWPFVFLVLDDLRGRLRVGDS